MSVLWRSVLLVFMTIASAAGMAQAAGSGNGPVGKEAPLRRMHVSKGVLYFDDGAEVALWGVNYQIALSWEYKNLSNYAGVPLNIGAFRKITDDDFEQLRKMRVGVVRAHLLPSDFTDGEGTLVETVFLDALDYLIDKCNRSGVYVYLTFINEMERGFLPTSFMAGYESQEKRKEYYFDEGWTRTSRSYIKNLLNRTNRYTGRSYKEEPSLAVLEIQNEPAYPDFKELDAIATVRTGYERWLVASHETKNKNTFNRFRSERVKQYINSVCADIRATGARQPVTWNLNWPKFIVGREDIFDAVAASDVEGISFCLYLGQGDVQQPYWEHPEDLSGRNYLNVLSKVYSSTNGLGWVRDKRYASKAKFVYEFETFYNQSGYLYPAMAKLLRGLGVQVATMWRYTMSPVAQFQGGSHYLNYLTTPRKTMSFIIAGGVLESTPRLTPYDITAKEQMVFGEFALSFPDNVSVRSGPAQLLYSAPLAWNPLPIASGVKRIMGLGASSLVSYEGSGIYSVDIGSSEIRVEINPDVTFVKPAWSKNWKIKPPTKLCHLDYQSSHTMTLTIPGWGKGCSVWRRENGIDMPIHTTGDTPLAFAAQPGEYRITRK